MLKFYDIDPAYANYLQQFDRRIPDISYGTNSKFVCGIVLSIAGYNYFAPISSNTVRQQTNILIEDDNGRVLSSIKFSFMFPAPGSTITPKNFREVRKVDYAYADLLEKEYKFCKKNEQAIRDKAMKVYKIGCNPGHKLQRNGNSKSKVSVLQKQRNGVIRKKPDRETATAVPEPGVQL